MKPVSTPWRRAQAAGFSLIEMIGVMAIMAIMASVLVPNVLKAIDRAAVAAEVQTLQSLGAQVKLYLKANAVPPTTAIPLAVPNWSTQLATYADLNPADVVTNRRQERRTYVLEPVTAPALPPRAMIISSMRSGLTPPAATSINTFARFDDIWQTGERRVPTGASASLWTGWSAVTGSGEYLVIERINLQAVYKTDFPTFSVVLVNKSLSKAVSYRVTLANGSVSAAANLPFSVAGTGSGGSSGGGGSSFVSTTPPVTITLGAKDRLDLYSASGWSNLDFSYTGGTTNKTFYFTDTGGWLPP